MFRLLVLTPSVTAYPFNKMLHGMHLAIAIHGSCDLSFPSDFKYSRLDAIVALRLVVSHWGLPSRYWPHMDLYSISVLLLKIWRSPIQNSVGGLSQLR